MGNLDSIFQSLFPNPAFHPHSSSGSPRYTSTEHFTVWKQMKKRIQFKIKVDGEGKLPQVAISIFKFSSLHQNSLTRGYSHSWLMKCKNSVKLLRHLVKVSSLFYHILLELGLSGLFLGYTVLSGLLCSNLRVLSITLHWNPLGESRRSFKLWLDFQQTHQISSTLILESSKMLRE